MDEIQEGFKRNSEVMDAFGIRLKNQFTLNQSYRRSKELEWLQSLRQYKGLYDPDVKIEANNSKVYPKITRSKVNIVLSRLHEMLFPETERNWAIEPTPEPRIAKEVVLQLALSLVQAKGQDADGNPILPTKDELRLAIKKFALESSEKMASEIDDQFTEMDYPEETKKVLRSGLVYGTGVMKGPLIGKRVKRLWEPDPTGDYHEALENEEVPYFEWVRLWDWYPDMTVTDLNKGEGSFESHMMTKHDLRDLMKRDDFYKDIIADFMEQHPNGDYVPQPWEVDLQVIEVEAANNAEKTTMTVSAQTTDDRNRSTYTQIGKKYRVLEFWGYVDGSDLDACGMDIKDQSLEYAANVWVLGNKVISAKLYEGALDRYKVFYYEKDETSVFGEGLPRVMRHSQIAVAGASRMLLDNASCVSGPQVEVNWSLLTPDTDIDSFYPRKIWYREGRGVEAQYPAIRALNFDSHIDELLSVITTFEQFSDKETTLPTWLIGQPVNSETAQATSGRMSMITISIKDVVKNFDSFTEKIIGDMYAWNMEFSQRTDIKGDYRIRARGVSSLVMKEIRMQALNQLTTTLSPDDMFYLDRRELLKERLRAFDLNIRVKSEVEAEEERKKAAESTQNQLSMKMMEAEINYKEAQTMAQLTKAKEKNVLAMKEAQTPPEMPAPGADPRMRDAELAEKELDLQFKAQQAELSQQKHAIEMLKKQLEIVQSQQKHEQQMELEEEKVESGIKLKEKVAQETMKQKKADKAAKKAKTGGK